MLVVKTTSVSLTSISWGDFNTQEKLKTMMMQNLGGQGGGGAVNKVHCGVCENVTVGNDQSRREEYLPLCIE